VADGHECPHVEYFAVADAFRVVGPGDGRITFVVECRVTCPRCGGTWVADARGMAVIPADATHARRRTTGERLPEAWPR
jgi:hypothetical protein